MPCFAAQLFTSPPPPLPLCSRFLFKDPTGDGPGEPVLESQKMRYIGAGTGKLDIDLPLGYYYFLLVFFFSFFFY